MRRIFFILLLFISIGISAQHIYVIDDIATDSVATQLAARENDSFMCGGDAGKIAVGDTIVIVGKTAECVVFEHNGGLRAVSNKKIVFASNNAEGIKDIYADKSVSGNHTAVGHFYGTMTPYYIIVVLLLISMLLSLGALLYPRMRDASLIGMFACLSAVAVLEFVGYYTIGTSTFWWCDSERYGFIGALWRIIPFVLVATCQIASLPLCHLVMKQGDGADSVKQLSILPATVSIAVVTPVLMYGGGIAQSVLNLSEDSKATWIVILVCLMLAGVVYSCIVNIRSLGWKKGASYTFFDATFIFACVVVVILLIQAFIKLVIQMILVTAAVSGVIYGVRSLVVKMRGGKELPKETTENA